jgi:hypothetical protein
MRYLESIHDAHMRVKSNIKRRLITHNDTLQTWEEDSFLDEGCESLHTLELWACIRYFPLDFIATMQANSVHPLFQYLLIHVPNQHMNMLQRPHALQNRRVLEPLYLGALHFLASLVPKLPLHKIFHNTPPLLCQGTHFINRQRFLRPYHDMIDPLRHRVRPVILDDLVVRRVGEGRLVNKLEFERPSGVEWLPEEALLQDVLGRATVLGFYMSSPRKVRFEEGGPALELIELADTDQVVDVFPGVWRKLVVSDAELVPVDGSKCKRWVVARERQGCGVRIGNPF